MFFFPGNHYLDNQAASFGTAIFDKSTSAAELLNRRQTNNDDFAGDEVKEDVPVLGVLSGSEWRRGWLRVRGRDISAKIRGNGFEESNMARLCK